MEVCRLPFHYKKVINVCSIFRMDAEGFIQSVETGMVLEVEGDKGARAGCRVRVGYKKPLDHETVANQRWRYVKRVRGREGEGREGGREERQRERDMEVDEVSKEVMQKRQGGS